MLRRHWLLAVLLAAGLTLRILAEVAYRPALFFSDSVRYLYLSGGNDPLGYRVLLKPVLLVGNLDAVAAVQHLIGLGMAIALYVVLLRRGAPRWLAALATAPVLVDGYQLQMEQSIMSDVLFEVLIVAGLVILLCERKPRTWMFIAGGLVLGASATVREVGQILILPALIFVLAAVPGWRRKLRQAAVLAAAFLLPILAYCTTSLAATGHFRLANQGTNELYGRVVLAANCHALRLPADEQALCPTGSLALKLGNDALVHSPQSPLRSFRPPGAGTSAIAGDFTHRVFWQDPLAVFAAIGGDALKLFAVTRVTDAGDTPIARWQFQPTYPTYQHVSLQTVRAAGQRYGGGERRSTSRSPRSCALTSLTAATRRGRCCCCAPWPGWPAASASCASAAAPMPMPIPMPSLPLRSIATPAATWRSRACCFSPRPSSCCSSRTRSSSAGAISCPRWSRCRPPVRSAFSPWPAT